MAFWRVSAELGGAGVEVDVVDPPVARRRGRRELHLGGGGEERQRERREDTLRRLPTRVAPRGEVPDVEHAGQVAGESTEEHLDAERAVCADAVRKSAGPRVEQVDRERGAERG